LAKRSNTDRGIGLEDKDKNQFPEIDAFETEFMKMIDLTEFPAEAYE